MNPAFQINLHADILNVIEVWINSVLYFRKVYSEVCFKDRIVFGCPIKVCK